MPKRGIDHNWQLVKYKNDWHYIDLGWIAAEFPCVGKMTTKIIGNIRENPECAERIAQAYYEKIF